MTYIIFVHCAITGIFTRFYGDRPPNILVDEGKFAFYLGGLQPCFPECMDGYAGELTLENAMFKR